jgi:hypothetical protein
MVRFRAMLAAIVTLVVLLPVASAQASTSDLEKDFADLIARERADAGLQELARFSDLTAGARGQAADIGEAGRLFHNPDLAQVATGWYKLGENVGLGYSVESLHSAFMASPGHRANVLDPVYDHLGVGVVLVGNQIYVAMVFADMPDGFSAPGELAGSSFDGRFSDDDGSVFEEAIESLAAAGITSGCGGDRFCPDDPVTRGQMAAFLQRALGLAVPSSDHFTDDDGSRFEEAIESLAAAGITSGCSETRFCPEDLVTRGQMAAFLTRSLATR